MADVKEKAFSTSLTSEVGSRVRMIAERENRSFANVIESAVKVFTLLPKEARDVLVAATVDPDQGRQRIKELARHMMYQDAVRRLDHAVTAAAEHMTVDHDPNDYDDAVVERRS